LQVFGIEELLLGPKALTITPEALGSKCQDVQKYGPHVEHHAEAVNAGMPTWIWQDGDPMGHPKFAELCEQWKEHVQPGVPHKHGLFEKCSGPTIDEVVFMLRNVSILVFFAVVLFSSPPVFLNSPRCFSTPQYCDIIVLTKLMFPAADA